MKARILALLAVVGPGLLAGLSDDDPAGITTYSILGADFGYQLLWVLVVSTVALVLFHELGARMGVVTGQGLTGLIRERYGVRVAALAVAALLVANVGTTCAEFAGIAAGFALAGVSPLLSVPLSAAAVAALVLKGSFRRVEHVLMLVASVFVAYVLSGLLARPNWAKAGRGLLVPDLPLTRDAVLVITATVGTTLAPWGLAFIQSYAADKRLTPQDLRYERLDVLVGAILTGVIGAMIVVACAATLNPSGRTIDDARDAAVALEPLAGGLASTLFGAGLVGAGLLAASVLPLSTAYSVSEALGSEAALDDSPRQAKVFYGTYVVVLAVAVAIVMIPGAPLVKILYLTQVLNAVLLLPILVIIALVVRDRDVMGAYAVGRVGTYVNVAVIAVLAICVAALAVLSVV